MKVIVPDVLQSYTRAREVVADGNTIAEVFDDLEVRFPGIRFRVINELEELRPNIKVFVNGERVLSLASRVQAKDEVFLMQALSGG